MMMYEGLCFAQWSMTLMSNAPFGCLASLHFSAFALMCADWNIKRTYGRRRRGSGERREGKYGSGVLGRKRIKELTKCMFLSASVGVFVYRCKLRHTTRRPCSRLQTAV